MSIIRIHTPINTYYSLELIKVLRFRFNKFVHWTYGKFKHQISSQNIDDLNYVYCNLVIVQRILNHSCKIIIIRCSCYGTKIEFQFSLLFSAIKLVTVLQKTVLQNFVNVDKIDFMSNNITLQHVFGLEVEIYH